MVLVLKKKKYQMGFLTFGFSYMGEHPMLCGGEVLANSSFNARNLCRHLTKYESLANRPFKFFYENY
jgi:hypothetical protein